MTMTSRPRLRIAARRDRSPSPAAARSPRMEADQADHHHRAVGRRRLDRPGHARHRGRAREGARPEDRHRQPARRLGLDRHQERARRAEGRLHLDRGRRAGPRHLPDARHARHASIKDWNLFLTVANIAVIGVNPDDAVQDQKRAARRDEGQAGRDPGRDRRRHLERPQRDGGDRQGDRRHLPARHLRRRQPGGRRHRRRRDRGDDAARRRADRHDPRQADAPARDGERQAARARGLRHDPAAVADRCPASRRRSTTSASSSRRACPTRSSRRSRRSGPRRSARARRSRSTRTSRGALFAPSSGEEAQKAVFPAIQANAWLLFRRRQGQGVAGHGRHPEALSRTSPSARMSTSGDVAYADLPPDAARALAASELRGGLAWMVFGIAVLALVVADGPARGAGHQPVHGARACCRGCSASSRSCSAA